MKIKKLWLLLPALGAVLLLAGCSNGNNSCRTCATRPVYRPAPPPRVVPACGPATACGAPMYVAPVR